MVARKPSFFLTFLHLCRLFQIEACSIEVASFSLWRCLLQAISPFTQQPTRKLCEYLFEVLFRLVRFVSKAFAEQISFASSGWPIFRIFCFLTVFSLSVGKIQLPLYAYLYAFFGGRRRQLSTPSDYMWLRSFSDRFLYLICILRLFYFFLMRSFSDRPSSTLYTPTFRSFDRSFFAFAVAPPLRKKNRSFRQLGTMGCATLVLVLFPKSRTIGRF